MAPPINVFDIDNDIVPLAGDVSGKKQHDCVFGGVAASLTGLSRTRWSLEDTWVNMQQWPQAATSGTATI